MSNDKQETIPMGKTVMVLVIPEPKVRKATGKAGSKAQGQNSLQPQGKAQDPRMGVLFLPQR